MALLSVSTSRSSTAAAILKNFVIPTRYESVVFDIHTIRIAAIVPTYKPGKLTVKLVEDLVRWSPQVSVYVVDDNTPQGHESREVFTHLAAVSDKVSILRTPANKMKAGALNFALGHIFQNNAEYPEVILNLDDDIVIGPSTVKNLVTELMSFAHLGAVCSQCRVFNKNKNILTRLQGLEYLGFNATRLADEGFYRGPLVMHGMLTAFRTEALRDVGGFTEGHLIEDYEITARLKEKGWSVKLAPHAPAWTIVPETFATLWLQRTRWLYGGLTVVARTKHPLTVLQDLIGHGAFFATVLAIDLLIIVKGGGQFSPFIAKWIITLSLLQFLIWYSFQVWLMRFYKEKNAYDWVLRVSVLPEFIYSNILTLIQVGAYFFLFFNVFKRGVTERSHMILHNIVAFAVRAFRACGYTDNWGTRTQ
jgi:cellulose synthase/poly-beta-1,6-N-acetylglucosamine synthase-like glycosyltransferase